MGAIKNNEIPSMGELKIAIKIAVKNAVTELFKINENFYYLVLITTGEAHPPYLSAGSTEGLEKAYKKYLEDYGYTPDNLKPNDLKWSFADSPYVFFGEKYFNDVERLFYSRPLMDYKSTTEEWNNEYNFRLEAMELALKELDEENVFERKDKRKHLFINVAPDYLNVKNIALRLNNDEALKQVLEDDALEDEDGGENIEDIKQKYIDFHAKYSNFKDEIIEKIINESITLMERKKLFMENKKIINTIKEIRHNWNKIFNNMSYKKVQEIIEKI